MRKPRVREGKEPGSARREVFRLLLQAAAAVLVMTGVIAFAAQRADVYGSSMEPVLHDGDILMVDKLSYRFSDPERYDIVVFRYGRDPERYYTKRIIGLPGETVQIADGEVWIDGSPLKDDVGLEPMEEAGRAKRPVVLGDDEYFVLGDNRNFSSDSRDFDVGNIKRSAIIGRIWFRIWPPGA